VSELDIALERVRALELKVDRLIHLLAESVESDAERVDEVFRVIKSEQSELQERAKDLIALVS
jgi:vesicle coat complex subunit